MVTTGPGCRLSYTLSFKIVAPKGREGENGNQDAGDERSRVCCMSLVALGDVACVASTIYRDATHVVSGLLCSCTLASSKVPSI